ncbi:hypothetical protein C8F04DRAFT_1274017 [Mycena alexandri]|uniref:Uncharacterized protein n=1 Tax=Mycena alexandri TaxID=1745969 RepID=A0AAD6WU94_9AGAR|nr:hypothetical protein C8F04DRAFT_1274017 [Mycena alexandri]
MSSCYLDIYAGMQAPSACHDPCLPEDLDAEQQDILGDVYQKSDSQPLGFRAPTPLLVGRLIFQLDDAPGLAKTRQNFTALRTGEKGQCKNNPKKKLHYMGCALCGPLWRRAAMSRAETVAVERFGGKSPVSSSQFFIVLADNEESLAKLTGDFFTFRLQTGG